MKFSAEMISVRQQTLCKEKISLISFFIKKPTVSGQLLK